MLLNHEMFRKAKKQNLVIINKGHPWKMFSFVVSWTIPLKLHQSKNVYQEFKYTFLFNYFNKFFALDYIFLIYLEFFKIHLSTCIYLYATSIFKHSIFADVHKRIKILGENEHERFFFLFFQFDFIYTAVASFVIFVLFCHYRKK